MAQHVQAPIVIVIGTRPEGIKLLPFYFACRQANIPTIICSTLQHSEMLTEVFELFDVVPDISLDIMRPGQDLFYVTQAVMQKIKQVFTQLHPSLVVVQGDTTSGMAAAMAAFYLKIPVAHIEAGLRTSDVHAPFPEEMNRRVLRVLASYHFAPTSWAAAQLLAEGVDRQSVFCVGNTVVDALRLMKSKIKNESVAIGSMLRNRLQKAQQENKTIMLLTMHRRESFDGGVERVLTALHAWLQDNKDVFCVYPYHPNPHVIGVLKDVGFAQLSNALLLDPLAYPELVYVLNAAHLVVTDSGGIQEEAVSLSKQVIVLREKTERMEAVWAGAAHLVGTNVPRLVQALDRALISSNNAMQTAQLFGDGYAAEKIVHILKERVHLMAEQKEATACHIKKESQIMKKVCVLGLGYIGLPTSIILAESGYEVRGVDVDQHKVDAINAGDPVVKEPELFEKLQIVLGDKQFSAATTVTTADYFVIAVPTPFKAEKKADLQYVDNAIAMIAPVLKAGDTIIIESTIPVGTTQTIAQKLAHDSGLQAGKDFFIAHCPERVLPGNIFYELVHNARIIGGINKASVERAKSLYAAFVTGELYLTDADTAELVKLVENSSRDVQVAFAHQVASMAHAIGRDPYEVIELANKHPRVDILRPSSGVGGHCLAVDPWFLVETFKDQAALLRQAREINDHRPQEIVAQIKHAMQIWEQEHHKKPVVALCGVAYKPDVDDIRESPALQIVCALSAWDTKVCDPFVKKEVLQNIIGDRVHKTTEVIDQSDVVVFLVAHTRFKTIDASCLAGKKILDFCGVMHQPKTMHADKQYSFWPAVADIQTHGTKKNLQEHMIE